MADRIHDLCNSEGEVNLTCKVCGTTSDLGPAAEIIGDMFKALRLATAGLDPIADPDVRAFALKATLAVLAKAGVKDDSLNALNASLSDPTFRLQLQQRRRDKGRV